MIREAIDRLLSLATPTALTLDNRTYTSKEVFPVKDPVPQQKGVHTLTGLIDYLTQNPDKLTASDLILHVEDAKHVALFSALHGKFAQRSGYLAATHEQPEFRFGMFMDIEVFIIELQAKFVQDATTAALLSIVGNITDGQVNTFTDDGVTQGVNVKTGIARIANTQVPNPVTLRPFRSFAEIEQPECRFVFRLKAGGADSRPQVALIEADGGAWELEAIRSVRDWLKERVSENVTIIA
jgi:hypothetical protein